MTAPESSVTVPFTRPGAGCVATEATRATAKQMVINVVLRVRIASVWSSRLVYRRSRTRRQTFACSPLYVSVQRTGMAPLHRPASQPATQAGRACAVVAVSQLRNPAARSVGCRRLAGAICRDLGRARVLPPRAASEERAMKRLTWLSLVCALLASGRLEAQQVIGGCPVLPADNIWNTPIDTLPVAGNSATLVNTIGASRGFHA